MRDVVTIQNILTTVAETGENVYSYQQAQGGKNVKASCKNLSQRKTEDGFIQGSGAEEWEVRLRYRSDISYTTQLLLKLSDTSGDVVTMKVKAIENVGNKDKDLRLRCETVNL